MMNAQRPANCRQPNHTMSASVGLFCRYSSLIVALLITILLLLVSIKPQQINCQTYTDCNRRNQQRVPAQTVAATSSGSRQQRQFNHRSSASSNQQQQQQVRVNARQQQQVEPSEEEAEFSLAPNGQQQVNSSYTILPAQLQQAEQAETPTTSADSRAHSTSTSLGPALASGGATGEPAAETAQNLSELSALANTTPAIPSDSISSPVVLQPPVTTTSSISASKTGGQLETQGNMTSSTSAGSTGAQQQQQQSGSSLLSDAGALPTTMRQPQQASARRMDDDQLDGMSAGPEQQHSFRRHGIEDQLSAASSGRHPFANGLAQPVSSSPSSISIITPLIGGPQGNKAPGNGITSATVSASFGDSSQQQANGGQQQSALMKPIFVLGNPLNERDYNNPPAFEGQQSQTQPQSMGNKAAKDVDSSSMNYPPAHQQKSITGKSIDGQHLQQQQSARSAPLPAQPANETTGDSSSSYAGDAMNGPPLIYSDGQLLSSTLVPSGSSTGASASAAADQSSVQNQQQVGGGSSNSSAISQQPPTPRLFQGPGGGAAVLGNNPRRPSLPPPVNQANAASGFRSPMSPSGPLLGGQPQQQQQTQQQPQPQQLQAAANSMPTGQTFYQTSPPYAGGSQLYSGAPVSPPTLGYNKPAFVMAQATAGLGGGPQLVAVAAQPQSQVPTPIPGTAPGSGYSGRRPLNITRVEHISAECSNDLIRAVIVFNGTFKGIIYSSGYVSDPTCLYVNGTGSTRYEFSIRLNQCGTLGRQELHQPTIPGEARRRDQVMWNTLSIQYNSIIEQEWDEHFRVSCEYGSDFWKTVSFSPFNVETNTGSPVVFTINPPQCQMDVLLGHGMGPKIVDGPVTVGDPLTLLIHMKSEKAGYDILVKNCVAHNGGKQRMQLIDTNGCVVNERFISPFRGTYNDNDLRHVTLYAYLKAFRFTGSPVLYLECEIHMCQNACPPQMCYWRRLSKRSVDEFDYEDYTNSSSSLTIGNHEQQQPIMSDSLNLFKALQVRQESEPTRAKRTREIRAEDEEAALVCYRHTEVLIFLATMGSLLLLVATVAVTCCWRIRRMSQFKHNRLAQSSGSLSPSLLSISGAISSANSIIASSGGSLLGLAASSGHKSASALTCPSWNLQQQQQQQQQRRHLQEETRQRSAGLRAPRFLAQSPHSSPFQASPYAAHSSHSSSR